MSRTFAYTVLILVLGSLFQDSEGHGKMIEPPSRNTAWRFGFNTPHNNDDNQLYCGGVQVQWGTYGGKCGVCGDSYGGPRDHEAGGKYATGTIVRKYLTGQVIDVIVDLSAADKGYFEFRVCPHNNPNTVVTQACLDKYLLQFADGRGSRYYPGFTFGKHTMRLRLPADVSCTQCVLQWKYVAGNNWGTDLATGKSCTGCGNQENFWNCADVAIGDNNRGTTASSRPITALKTQMATKVTETPPVGLNCRAIGAYTGLSAINAWCIANCGSGGTCPSHICLCQ